MKVDSMKYQIIHSLFIDHVGNKDEVDKHPAGAVLKVPI
jgi:hypothetical protein